MRIDAHQHFWQYDPVRDGWITDEMGVLKANFLPTDLEPLLRKHQFDGCVAVQADQSLTETDFLLNLSQKHDFIKGVVGWVDLKSETLIPQLEIYADAPNLKGYRYILQAEPTGFMTDTAFVQGVKCLAKFDKAYDVLTHEGQLKEVMEMIGKLPEMRLVIDHISKPNIKEESFDHWAKYMKKLAQFDHVYIKLSGMITEADWYAWKAVDLQPYVDFMLEQFGTNRLMYGSDWPVCQLAGNYSRVIESLETCIDRLSTSEQQMIMGGTATEFYKL